MDFDQIVNRYGSNSLKYDFKKDKNKPEDVFPMWVADMDFKCCDEIINEMNKKIQHGIFGYSQTDDSYFQAINNWYLKRNNVALKKEWLIKTPGVVFALAMTVRTLTKEGDCVLISNPVYYPFSEVILDNDRKVISSDLINNNGHYEIDFDDFEKKIIENNIGVYLLCSPHNPVGRVWTKDELDRIICICKKHNVFIVSDEIHSDFIWEGVHTCLLKYDDYLENMIVCTSPSKTFNIAGLQISNIFIPNKEVRDKFQMEIWKTGYSLVNVMGIVACCAAYEKGEEWLEQVKVYLKKNIDYVENFFKENFPDIKVVHPEGTYLLWLDFNELNLSDEEIENKMLNEAKLWLDNGKMFGESGEGFQRLNIALPYEQLKKALEKIKAVFR